jgi:hypothetical protein
MRARFLPCGTVEDAAVALIGAAACLAQVRAEVDGLAADMETRWAANRAMRAAEGEEDIAIVCRDCLRPAV